MTTKENLKKLVGRGQVKQAIEELLVLFQGERYNGLNNNVRTLLTRYNTNEQKNMLGVIDNDEHTKEHNKIAVALLEYIDQYDENMNIPSEPKQPVSPPNIEDIIDNSPLKILMLTANHGGRLSISDEHLRITQKLKNKKGAFSFHFEEGISKSDFKEKTEEQKPSLLHFSGHGEAGGLETIDINGRPTLLTNHALNAYFKYFKTENIALKAVILNACFSEEQAEIIAKYVPYVIGTTLDIGDDCAIAFSQGFYYKLADDLLNIERAYNSGVTQASAEGAEETHFIIYKDGKKLA